MIYIVVKDNTLYRAFPSHEEADKYKVAKIKIMHDHCCVCENCPNISYYAEHDRTSYNWKIVPFFFEGDVNGNLLFVVCEYKEIVKIFPTYKSAKLYVDEQEENEDEDEIINKYRVSTFKIKVCKYSKFCSYIILNNKIDENEEYKSDNTYLYETGTKLIDNEI